MFSCDIWKICKSAFLEEYDQTATSEYRSINSSEGGIGKRNCEYITEIKAYQFEP